MAQDWEAIAKAAVPAAPAQEPEGTVGTLAGLGADWERGASAGARSWHMLRALVMGEDVADELAAENLRTRQLPQSEGGKAWEEADGFWEALTAFAQSPIEVAGGIAATSIRSQLQAMLEVAPAAAPVGAGVGALFTPIGAATGAAATTVGAASALLGYTDEIMNLLEEIGLDTTDPEQLRLAFASPKIMAEVRGRAALYGGVTGLFDALSAGVAGKATGGVLGKAVKEFALQGALGGAGEAGAELASGKELSPKEILGEVIGEAVPGGGGTPEVVAGQVIPGRQATVAEQTPTLATAPEQTQAAATEPEVAPTVEPTTAKEPTPPVLEEASQPAVEEPAPATVEEIPPPASTEKPPIEVPGETALTRFARDWQNRREPIERLVEGVRKSRVVNEFRDVSASEKVRQGRVADAAAKEFERRVMPLVRTVKEADLPRELGPEPKQTESLAGYLQARHAPERNAYIAAINPNLPDGGSGWTNEEAQQYVARIESGPKAEAYKLAAKQFDEINAETRRIWVKYGLESQEYVEALEEKFPHYSPLRTDMEGEATDAVGSGISIGGYHESRQALGRTTVADDPLQFAVLQLQRAIERGERNRSFQRAFSLFGMQGLDYVATRDDPTLKRSLVTRAGTTRVENRFDPSYRDDPAVVVGKIDGVEHAIHFKPGYEDMGRALKLADAEQVPSAFKLFSTLNRGLSQLFTRYNPAWVPVNAVRDLLQTALNIGAEESLAVAAKVVGDVVSGRTYMALMHNKGSYAQYVDRYKAAGGPISFANLKQLTDIKRDLDNAFKEGPAQKWHAFTNAITRLSDVSEQQARFAVFVRGVKDLGLSDEKAAILSKEASINFETRGNYASLLNSLFIFANANIQGAERFGRLMVKAATSKQAAGVLAGAVGGSFALALLNYSISGEDDDGESWYDKLSPHDRDRNLILMDPTGTGRAYKLPLPPGVNFLNALGWRTAAAITHQADPASGLESGKAAAGTILALLDAFSFTGPLASEPAEGRAGFEETIPMSSLAPTITRPFVEVAMNKDYAGRAIAPTRFPGTSKADAELFWPDVSPTARTTASWLNKATGGDEMRPGGVDVSPETIEHVSRFFAGGPARILGQAYNIAEKSAAGLPIESYEVPFTGRFYSSPSEQRIEASFRQDVKEVLEVGQRIAAAREGKLSSSVEVERASPLAHLVSRAKTKKALVDKIIEKDPERAKRIMQEFSADVVEAKRRREAG